MFIWLIREQNAKGGRGSGNWGHLGRKGIRGGSTGLKDTPLDRLQLGGEKYVAAKEPKNGRSTIARRTEKVSRSIDESTLNTAEGVNVSMAEMRGGSKARLLAMEGIVSSRAELRRINETLALSREAQESLDNISTLRQNLANRGVTTPPLIAARQEVITSIQEDAKIVAKNTKKSSKKAIDIIKEEIDYEYLDDRYEGKYSGRTQKEVADIMQKTFEKVELPQDLVDMIDSGKASVRVKITGDSYEVNIYDGYPSSHLLYVKRKFLDEDTVYNDYFQIDKRFRGSNIATQLYASQEKALIEAGVSKVKIQANIDVGGYAWARMGFSFDESENNYPISVVMDREWVSSGWGGSYVNGRIAKMTGSDNFADLIKNQVQGKQPHEIATMNFEYEGTKISGKDLLLGTNWYAVKNLNPNDVGYQLGQAYYQSKGVTP